MLIDLYFCNLYSVPMNTVRHWLECPSYRAGHLALTNQGNIICSCNLVE